MHARTTPAYSLAELLIVSDGFDAGLTDDQIVDKLAEAGFHRTWRGIKARRSRLRMLREFQDHAAERKPNTIKGDLAFKQAMLKAIRDGEENAIVGVVKDRRPFALNTIRPEPQISMCSSSAGWANQATDDDRKPSDLTYR